MIFPFVWIAFFSIFGLMPLHTIIAFLTLPVAIGCAKTMLKAPEDINIIADLDVRTANLQLMFSLLLAAAFTVARFF